VGILNLQLFPDCLMERFVVGHLLDQLRYPRTENACNLGVGGFRIFDGVMQYGSNEQSLVTHVGFGQHGGHCDRVVDVGRSFCAFALLAPVFVSREY
jgi:hypothetical protein